MSLFTKPSGPAPGRTHAPGRGGTRGRWQRGRFQRGRPYNRGWNQNRNSSVPSSPASSISSSSSSTPINLSGPSQALLVRAANDNGPYRGWPQYFPDEEYDEHSETVRRTQIFEKYILSWRQQYKFEDIRKDRFYVMDLNYLLNDHLMDGLPDLKETLRHKPENIINCMGLAMHQIATNEMRKTNLDTHFMHVGSDLKVPKIEVRITNFQPITQLRHIKASYYSKFVTVKGTVVRVSNLKPICTKMAFQCLSCNSLQVQTQPDGKYVVPVRCPAQGCRGKHFYPQRTSQYTECVDWQIIRVQENLTDDHRESGRIPRTVDCELTSDLVDTCVPGDVVTVSGIVKVSGSENSAKGNKNDKCMFLLYIYANSLVNAKGRSQAKGQIELSDRDMEAIEEIKKEDNLFRFLVSSLCPSIYGHEMVKAGFVLSLFGGSQRFCNDKNHVPVRGDPHVLVVGDPGLGKSQMLQAVSNVAPRSVYVCGNSTTTSGLTVTISKDGSNGDCALEAGALVLADQGVCCIDEFDKMGTQHNALLEAMEQQQISIAKAGIVCSLPARTSIIAAANPVGGHYNKAKTVSENLKMNSALLSRFDLVFIMLDKPDMEMDSLLSEHVMNLHAGIGKNLTLPQMLSPAVSDQTQPLQNRLKLQRGEMLEPLPSQLFRKYVSYARKKIHPKIGKEAAKVLQHFYLDLRKNHQTADSTPITTRQLESLIRLTEARAKLELRLEATQEDAEDVISIMKFSMIDTYSNEFGFLDFKRSQHGSGMSSKATAKKFVSLLQQVSERSLQSVFSYQQMKELAAEAGMKFRDFEGMIASLNNQGYLLQKGNRLYQLQTAGL